MEQCLTTTRGKTRGKSFGDPKLSPKLGFFPFSEGCSLGQCVTFRRAEGKEKNNKKKTTTQTQTCCLFVNKIDSSRRSHDPHKHLR